MQPLSSGFYQSRRKIATTSLGGEFTLLVESFPHLSAAEPSMSTVSTNGQRTDSRKAFTTMENLA
jgi:hypothetical protein